MARTARCSAETGQHGAGGEGHGRAGLEPAHDEPRHRHEGGPPFGRPRGRARARSARETDFGSRDRIPYSPCAEDRGGDGPAQTTSRRAVGPRALHAGPADGRALGPVRRSRVRARGARHRARRGRRRQRPLLPAGAARRDPLAGGRDHGRRPGAGHRGDHLQRRSAERRGGLLRLAHRLRDRLPAGMGALRRRPWPPASCYTGIWMLQHFGCLHATAVVAEIDVPAQLDAHHDLACTSPPSCSSRCSPAGSLRRSCAAPRSSASAKADTEAQLRRMQADQRAARAP